MCYLANMTKKFSPKVGNRIRFTATDGTVTEYVHDKPMSIYEGMGLLHATAHLVVK